MDEAVVQLINQLARFGPWAFFVGLFALLYKKELWALLTSFREERGMSKLLEEMNVLFEKNLEYFEQANRGVLEMHNELKQQTALLHRLVEEIIRRRE